MKVDRMASIFLQRTRSSVRPPPVFVSLLSWPDRTDVEAVEDMNHQEGRFAALFAGVSNTTALCCKTSSQGVSSLSLHVASAPRCSSFAAPVFQTFTGFTLEDDVPEVVTSCVCVLGANECEWATRGCFGFRAKGQR